jgi:hypothetical protein
MSFIEGVALLAFAADSSAKNKSLRWEWNHVCHERDSASDKVPVSRYTIVVSHNSAPGRTVGRASRRWLHCWLCFLSIRTHTDIHSRDGQLDGPADAVSWLKVGGQDGTAVDPIGMHRRRTQSVIEGVRNGERKIRLADRSAPCRANGFQHVVDPRRNFLDGL